MASRFLADRLDGLRPRYRGQAPTILTPAMEARILEKTRQGPSHGSTHWSTRKLGRLLEIHHNLVAKAWQRAGLQPHRFARYMESDDPDFEPKAADVIGLYVNPRNMPPCSRWTRRRRFRRSTASIRCCRSRRAAPDAMALNTIGTARFRCWPRSTRGPVRLGHTVPRHTSAAFVDFLGDLVTRQPATREIHVIPDNLSTHKTQAVRTFLMAHPNVHLHFTPTMPRG